eukprot:gb/GEZN01001928.1/.p1 GENE.gb/GEZN01001928.1/~~gb/GEZN01001928.1/.p1  ORF type:complete len:907 (-),score=56.79 gb/GEZN01001928.1/:21-2441(-)
MLIAFKGVQTFMTRQQSDHRCCGLEVLLDLQSMTAFFNIWSRSFQLYKGQSNIKTAKVVALRKIAGECLTLYLQLVVTSSQAICERGESSCCQGARCLGDAEIWRPLLVHLYSLAKFCGQSLSDFTLMNTTWKFLSLIFTKAGLLEDKLQNDSTIEDIIDFILAQVGNHLEFLRKLNALNSVEEWKQISKSVKIARFYTIKMADFARTFPLLYGKRAALAFFSLHREILALPLRLLLTADTLNSADAKEAYSRAISLQSLVRQLLDPVLWTVTFTHLQASCNKVDEQTALISSLWLPPPSGIDTSQAFVNMNCLLYILTRFNEIKSQQLALWLTQHALPSLSWTVRKCCAYVVKEECLDKVVEAIITLVLVASIVVPGSRTSEITSSLDQFFVETIFSNHPLLERLGVEVWAACAARGNSVYLCHMFDFAMRGMTVSSFDSCHLLQMSHTQTRSIDLIHKVGSYLPATLVQRLVQSIAGSISSLSSNTPFSLPVCATLMTKLDSKLGQTLVQPFFRSTLSLLEEVVRRQTPSALHLAQLRWLLLAFKAGMQMDVEALPHSIWDMLLKLLTFQANPASNSHLCMLVQVCLSIFSQPRGLVPSSILVHVLECIAETLVVQHKCCHLVIAEFLPSISGSLDTLPQELCQAEVFDCLRKTFHAILSDQVHRTLGVRSWHTLFMFYHFSTVTQAYSSRLSEFVPADLLPRVMQMMQTLASAPVEVPERQKRQWNALSREAACLDVISGPKSVGLRLETLLSSAEESSDNLFVAMLSTDLHAIPKDILKRLLELQKKWNCQAIVTNGNCSRR